MVKMLNKEILDVDMRDAFFDEVYNIAKNDSHVIFLTGDMGAFSLDRFKKDLPNQYINMGAAEQNMVSVAAGLALGGKKVFIYSIVSFATMRCFEQIRVDLCCMRLPVTIVGTGSGVTYGSDGPTHHALQDVAIMRALPEMTIFNPSDAYLTQAVAKMALECLSPSYVRIEKGKLPAIYDKDKTDFSQGLAEIRSGNDLLIIATGNMAHQALETAAILEEHSLSAAVMDLYRLKPLNAELLLKIIDKSKHIVTLEENTIIGGLGSAVSEILSDHVRSNRLKRIAFPDQYCFESGDRASLQTLYGLASDSIAKSIMEWLDGFKN
jgi:transketolase